MHIIYFISFWICQIASSIIFKSAGIQPKYQWLGLLLGNAILIGASWFLLQLFKSVPQPIVIALCSGGTFLSVQLAMALWFKESLSLNQILGSFIIIVGMVLVTFGGKSAVQS
ncbi:hypothetical protein ACFRAE_13045 [Sphingobacterium sp. HJSM2_6]|uniref:hypothetical protein n=1 Tax=Sphingobacterium sp. HJSM2_6 TaxID=3366264 RepID=UPI003BC61C4F